MSSESTAPAVVPAALSFPAPPAVSRPGGMPGPAGQAPGMPAPFVAAGAWSLTEADPVTTAQEHLQLEERPGASLGAPADSGEEWAALHPGAAGGEFSPAPAPSVSSDRAWLEAMDWIPVVDEAGDELMAADAVQEERAPASGTAPGSELADAAAGEAGGDLPPWMAWMEEETGAAGAEAPVVDIEDILAEPRHGPDAAPASPQEVRSEPDLRELVEQAVEDRERATAASVTEATARLREAEAPLPAAFAGVFHEVADRLENIAGSLRRRSSGEAGAANTATDPLELLLTGFVLGYVARQGRGSAPPEKDG